MVKFLSTVTSRKSSEQDNTGEINIGEQLGFSARLKGTLVTVTGPDASHFPEPRSAGSKDVTVQFSLGLTPAKHKQWESRSPVCTVQRRVTSSSSSSRALTYSPRSDMIFHLTHQLTSLVLLNSQYFYRLHSGSLQSKLESKLWVLKFHIV